MNIYQAMERLSLNGGEIYLESARKTVSIVWSQTLPWECFISISDVNLSLEELYSLDWKHRKL